jgi:hypothetical protein
MKKILFIFIFFIVIACKEKDNDIKNDNFDRTLMLTNYAENYIIPNYQQFYNSIIALEESFLSVKNNDDIENIEKLKSIFKETYLKWQRIAFLSFGPGEFNSLLPLLNSFPTSTIKIKSNIETGQYNLFSAGNTDAISFPALDFLFFSEEEEIYERYNNSNYKKYVADLINLIKERTDKTLSEWQNYKVNFAENNGNSIGSSLSSIVNSINMYWEKDLRDGKLGIPIGIRTNGVYQISRLEGIYSGMSLELLIESVDAYINFYSNGEANNYLGLYDLVHSRRNSYGDGTLHQKLLENFKNIKTRLSQINGTLEYNISNNHSELLSIYQDIQRQIVFLKVDMPAILGVSITYQDNDGD